MILNLKITDIARNASYVTFDLSDIAVEFCIDIQTTDQGGRSLTESLLGQGAPIPQPTTPEASAAFLEALSVVQTDGPRSNREKDDSYRGVVLPLDPRWRLITASDGSQWVLQWRESKDHWEGRKYFARASHIEPIAFALIGIEAGLAVRAWAASLKHDI